MIDIEKMLYNKIKAEISTWDEDDIYAISFFIYANQSYEYKDFSNVSTWAISYNTEADCEDAGPLDEERWNYAFWRQDETSIIDIYEPDECTEALYKWYAEQGITNIGFEDYENMYDEEQNYIGKGPVGHYELIGIATNVAKKLQKEGFIKNKFGKSIPIIIHGLEYAWYYIEATQKANPNGESDTFIKAMAKNGIIPSSERSYPFSLFLIGYITNLLFRFSWLFIPSIILLIIGIFVDWCLYAGLALLAIDIIASFVEQMKIRKTMLSDSENEDFQKFQNAVLKDGNTFENIKNWTENAIDNTEIKKNDLVMDTYDYICEKCKYGDDIEKLNEHERIIFVTQILEQEVNNGGFAQFFYNSSGDFSNELVDAFTKIGALKTAKICKKALTVFNGDVPTDKAKREKLLDNLKRGDVLSECDDKFYEYEDNLKELNYTYIMEHRSYFE